MSLFARNDLGAPAFDRMVRDGALVPLGDYVAADRFVPVTPALRARTVQARVPPGALVSGLFGLWIHFGGHAPRVAHVVGARGLHRTAPAPPGEVHIECHSGPAFGRTAIAFGGVEIAPPARCAADALRWDALEVALQTVYRTVSSGLTPRLAVAECLATDDRRGRGYARAHSAWAALNASLAAR